MKRRNERRTISVWWLAPLVLVTSSCDGCFGGGDVGGCAFDPTAGAGGGGGGSALDCDDLCGGTCCLETEVCFASECVVPAGPCTTPGDCDEGSTCDFTLASDPFPTFDLGGAPVCSAPPEGVCVPEPDLPFSCALTSALQPPQLVEGDTWGDPAAPDAGDSVLTTPAVIALDDNNCDGRVDGYDRPAVLFTTATESGAGSHGALHAVVLTDEGFVTLWSTDPGSPANDPAASLAAVRIDDDVLIATCTVDDRVRAFDALGNERWVGPLSAACDSVAITDFDADGLPEVVTESQVLAGLTGAELATYGPAPSHGFVIGRVGELTPRIVTAGQIYDEQGTLLADVGIAGGQVAMMGPTIVATDPNTAELVLWRWWNDGVVIDATIELHEGFTGSCPMGTLSGGPPTVLDTDAGSLIAVATALGPVLFDEDGNRLWQSEANDCAFGTQPVVLHDVDGNGMPELARHTGLRLALHQDDDGVVLQGPCRPVEAGTALPIVVDLDADGFGELLTIASARFGTTCDGQAYAGLAVHELTEPRTRTRALHSQFAYRPGDVTDDGTVELSFSMGTRAQPATANAPNLQLTAIGDCNAEGLVLRVVNRGSAALAAGRATVTFRQEATGFAAEGPIPVTLEPGAGLDLTLASPPSGELEVSVIGVDGTDLGTCNPLEGEAVVTCE